MMFQFDNFCIKYSSNKITKNDKTNICVDCEINNTLFINVQTKINKDMMAII